MDIPRQQGREAPRLVPMLAALAQAGVLVLACAPSANAAALHFAVPSAADAPAPMLYIAQSTQDYSKYPGAWPPPPPPSPPEPAAKPAAGAAPGGAAVPAKPAPPRDARDSSR